MRKLILVTLLLFPVVAFAQSVPSITELQEDLAEEQNQLAAIPLQAAVQTARINAKIATTQSQIAASPSAPQLAILNAQLAVQQNQLAGVPLAAAVQEAQINDQIAATQAQIAADQAAAAAASSSSN